MNASQLPVGADQTDAELVARCRTGDQAAFARIVARHQSLICALAYSGIGNLAQSEDLAQETFVAAWRHLPDLREPAKLRAWLCEIVRNRVHQLHNQQGREPGHAAESLESVQSLVAPEPSPSRLAIQRDQETILWREIEKIPELYREPLILFYRQSQSIESVAAALDLTEDVVKQRLSRGRKLLQEQMLVFVEDTLARTKPDSAFTSQVMTALPIAAVSSLKTAILAATAKSAVVTKGTGILGLLGVFLWPIAALVAALRFAINAGIADARAPQKNDSEPKPKPKLDIPGGLVEIALVLLIMGVAVHYFPAHPAIVLCTLLGMPLVNILVFAWLDPRRAIACFDRKRWNFKTAGRWCANEIGYLLLGMAMYFAAKYYLSTTLFLLRATGVGLFLTLWPLATKTWKRWDWWRFILRAGGSATSWVMIFMVKDYYSVHPIEFCVTSSILFVGFVGARRIAEIYENPPEKIRRRWEENRLKLEERLLKREEKMAKERNIRDLLKGQWAATKKPRLANILLFVVFVLTLPRTGDPLSTHPAFYSTAASVLIALMSINCIWTLALWVGWHKRSRQKIQTLQTTSPIWMTTINSTPPVAALVMLLLTLTIFFHWDLRSLVLNAAAMGFLVIGLGMFVKSLRKAR